VQGWGPVWSSSRGGVAISAGRGARRLAGTALVAALVAPIIVPGFGSRAVIDFGASSQERVTVDPFVAVNSQLARSTPVTVLEFTSPEPTYLRLVSLPNFDGEGWRPDPQTGLPLGEGGAVPNFSSLLPGGIPEASAEPVGVRIVTDLGFAWVPTPYPVRSIQAGGSTVTYDSETGTAFAEPALREGDAYALSATFATPSADELRSIPDSPGFGAPGGVDRYLALPPGLNPEIEEIARAWTAGEDSVFDRAFAIQERLTSPPFEYDENFEVGDGPDAILTFLRETRAGFCQQFAASMALMLRTLDIPARVVVGFGSGRSVRGGGYEVSSDRLHAWVEVNFKGFGWMPFEPTPRRENPVVEAYTAPAACSGVGCGDGNGGNGSGASAENPRAASQGLNDPRPAVSGPRGREGGAGSVTLPSETSPISARLALLIAVTLAGVGFLLLPVVRAIRRRIALGRAAGEPRRTILVTYEQFTERAAGMGLARARGETFDEYRRKVLETGYLSNGQLDRLTRIATAAAYSPREPDQGDARSASEAAGTALTEIRRAVGRARWLVGLYRR
jgi:transglutaminase-like putative cysteine protease